MNIIEKIIDLYENILPKNQIMLPHSEALEYFERLMMNGNIITYVKDGELLGFLEFWKVNFEQFGRICAGVTLDHSEDLLNGNIGMITRMWITPTMRNGETFLHLGRAFLEKNQGCSHYAAMQFHKNHKPLQVYSRDQIIKHYRMEK